MNIFQNFTDYFEQFPLVIKLVWASSGVLIFSIMILVGYLKFIRNRLRNKEKIVSKYRKKYESLLVEYLYADVGEEAVSIEQQAIIKQLKINITDKFKRKIIVSILYKLMYEISGEMADSIKILYFRTGLIDFASTKLKSKNWYVIAKGIGELARFHIKEVHDEVIKHVNHPRNEVRKEVQLYLVNQFRFKGLVFLNDLNTPLSEWDQVQLLEVLQKFDDQEICDIRPWLKSANDYVVIFALKLAKTYNQFEVKDVLIDLLSHKSQSIRVQVIPVLSHLHVIEAKKVLKTNFNERSLEEQISFFKMLEDMSDIEDESFLLEHAFHKNFEIKFSAFKIMKFLNMEKLESLVLKSGDLDFNRMLKFVKNS